MKNVIFLGMQNIKIILLIQINNFYNKIIKIKDYHILIEKLIQNLIISITYFGNGLFINFKKK